MPSDDDDLFSNQPSISSLLTQLRRSTLTPGNRLKSIHADASFVAQVASAFPSPNKNKGKRRNRPLVANERCGSWYIPPGEKDGSAYFKSTDGHERAWKFSTRRLNLHLIDMIEENDGIIIVDSTRRGKRKSLLLPSPQSSQHHMLTVSTPGMPDALSTTIPIWCTVLNLALLPSHPLSANLFLPPYLPASTHSQITALIPSFLSSLKELNLNLPTSLTKPLRPLWITQDSSLPPPPSSPSPDDDEDDDDDPNEEEDEDRGVIFQDYRPVICCTASRRVVGSEVDEGGYIQGAGDDTENWAMGLTPDVFWAHAETLLSASEAQLPELIVKLVQEAKAAKTAAAPSSGDGAERQASSLPRKQLTPYISVRALSPLDISLPPSSSSSSSPLEPQESKEQPPNKECLILLTETQTPKESWLLSPTLLRVGLGKHKTASRNLRLALPEICSFAANFLLLHETTTTTTNNTNNNNKQQPSEDSDPVSDDTNTTTTTTTTTPPQIVVACDSGRDLSVGVALALSCYLFDDKGRVRDPDEGPSFTKTLVKMRLGAVMTAYPEANPSRNTLQSVNSFLMDWRS